MSSSIGYYGEKLDLLIRQGADFGPVLGILLNPNLTPVNLTGCTVRGQIRRRALDAVVVATLVCVITDAPAGKYTFGLPLAVTTAMAAGARPEDPLSRYEWDLELLDALGRVTPLRYGSVVVLREVTRV